MAAGNHSDQRSENTQTLVEHSVDELAKGLATGTVSRRKVLRMLGAALLGGLLASVPGVAWAAKPAPCPSGNRCGKSCCPDVSFVCSKGRCACPSGTTQCGGSCLNPATFQTDPNNCGSCGNVCPLGQGCVNGQCTLGACPAENLSLCCNCSYRDASGTVTVTSCQVLRSSTTCYVHEDCRAVCEANTPPGMQSGGFASRSSCENFAGTNQQDFCEPNTTIGQTGTLCGRASCSAGT